MSIADLERKWTESNNVLARLIGVRDQAAAEAATLKAKAEEAALANDLESYKDLKAQAEDLEAFAYVQSKQIEKANNIPVVEKEEAVDAWSEYASEYNANLKEKIAKFEEAKHIMLKEFCELVDMQNCACATRERLASFIGKKRDPSSIDGGLGSLFPMEYIPCQGRGTMKTGSEVSMQGTSVCDPNAVFYLNSLGIPALDLYKSEEEQTVKSVLVWRMSR